MDNFVTWCEDNFLLLNVSKTKELIIDFRRKIDVPLAPIKIKGDVEIVDLYKYLGVTVDNKPRCTTHFD